MKTVAFVPIRLNSQRVSGKNLRLLGGEPLMCHILRTLTRVEGIDEVYVFCSDERIRELLPEGVRFLQRSAELDRDTTLGREIYNAFTARVEADLYVLAHATSPFIRPETISGALAKVQSGEYDSAFSAEKIQTFAWFKGRPLNYALDNIPRTQTIEPVYIETSAFFIFPRGCGAATTAASATAPTWRWSSGSRGSTSTIRRTSPWQRLSPPAADSEPPAPPRRQTGPPVMCIIPGGPVFHRRTEAEGGYFGSASCCSASCCSASPARS